MRFADVYPLQPYQSSDPKKLRRVIAAYPLAMVISQCSDYPAVSQLPLIYDADENVLRGHLDRNNPHCEELRKGGHIYCVFNGPNHYVSPTIYPDPHYPGWVYIAVHVEGTVRAIDDREWLQNTLLETARHNEPPDSGYKLVHQQEHFETLINYILGFEIEISDMRGIIKLAQDKGPAHAALAKDHLANQCKREISDFLTEMLEADEGL